MTAIILHRSELAAFPYEEWLADYPSDLVLLASSEKLRRFAETLPPAGPGHRFSYAEAFDGYDTSHEVERRALNLGRELGATHLVACAEFDVERAARLRESLNLSGQQPASARSFRDKVVMKSRAASAVDVGVFRGIETAGELASFAAQHGYPVVLKPRNGSASVDTHLLGTDDELRDVVRKHVGATAHRANLMVEAFTEGDMYHVDGLVLDNEIVLLWPSRYASSTLGYLAGVGLSSQMLNAHDPLTPRLQETVRRLLTALSTPENTTVHAEVFHTPQDNLVLCEIASRTGGARVKHTIQAAFGVDITMESVRAQCGLPPSRALGSVTASPAQLAGWALVAPQPGVVAELPPLPEAPWVAHADLNVTTGTELGNAASSVDHVASFVVTGAQSSDTEERLARCVREFTCGWTVVPC